MAKEPFFMVYLEATGKTPAYKHKTLDSAETEAKRLAQNHGQKAFVLSSLKSFEHVKYNVEDCRPQLNDELPF